MRGHNVGSLPVNGIAKWDGTRWSNVGGGVTGGFGVIWCMTVYDGELYVGGHFSYGGNVLSQYISKWNGARWDSVGSALGALDNYPTAMEVDTINNVLFVAGGFTQAGGISSIGVAKWDGTNWTSASIDTLWGTVALAMYHNELYAGGSNVIMAHNGEQLNNIYRWDGLEWHSVLGGTNNGVRSLKVFHDTLYVGGYFDTVNGMPMNRIARYYNSPLIIHENHEEKSFFKLYPNPAKNEITIEIQPREGSQISDIRIYDIDGKLEKETSLKQLIQDRNKTILNIQFLKKGIYVIELSDKENINCSAQKFAVE